MKKCLVKFTFSIGLLLYFLNIARADWVQTNGPSGRSIYALTVTGNTIFAGTDSGVFRSTNNGTQWTAVNNGLPSIAPWVLTFAVNGNNIFAGGTGPGVYLSTNNGSSWANTDSGFEFGGTIYSLAASGSYLLAGTLGWDPYPTFSFGYMFWGNVYLSSNNGKSWTSVLPVISLSLASNGSNFYVITTTYHSYNSGIEPLDTPSGFLYSSNFGANWTDESSNLHVRLSSLFVKNDSIFAGTISNGILLSTNNGLSWTPINSGLPDSTSVYSFVMSGNVIFAGTSKGVFSSANSGMSWTAFNTGLPSKVGSLAIIGNTIFAAINGNGVWRRPLSEVTEVVNPKPRQELLKQENICIHSSSRTNPYVTIEFSLPHSNQVTAVIYDLCGHEIASLVDKRLGSGPHSVIWDTRNRAPGCYAVKMRVGSNTYVRSIPVFR